MTRLKDWLRRGLERGGLHWGEAAPRGFPGPVVGVPGTRTPPGAAEEDHPEFRALFRRQMQGGQRRPRAGELGSRTVPASLHHGFLSEASGIRFKTTRAETQSHVGTGAELAPPEGGCWAGGSRHGCLHCQEF